MKKISKVRTIMKASRTLQRHAVSIKNATSLALSSKVTQIQSASLSCRHAVWRADSDANICDEHAESSLRQQHELKAVQLQYHDDGRSATCRKEKEVADKKREWRKVLLHLRTRSLICSRRGETNTWLPFFLKVVTPPELLEKKFGQASTITTSSRTRCSYRSSSVFCNMKPQSSWLSISRVIRSTSFSTRRLACSKAGEALHPRRSGRQRVRSPT